MASKGTKKRAEPTPRLRSPDFRSKQVRLDKVKPEDCIDPYMREFSEILWGQEDKASDGVYYAYLIDQVPYARAVTRSLLLSKAPVEAFVNILDMGEETLLAYSRLFFDVGVFPNRLFKDVYVRQLSEIGPEDKFERDMMLWGLQLGWKYILWKIAGSACAADPAEALQGMLTDAVWRSREHILSTATDQRAAAARAWMPQALKALEISEKISPNRVNSLEELRIRLVGADITRSIEDLGNINVVS
jgi:hypothetical protein